MRRIVAIGVAAVGVVAILGLGLTSVQASDKVDICHFTGHESDEDEPIHDFFVETSGHAAACVLRGGNVITVAMAGAVNGHGAIDFPDDEGGPGPD